MKSNRLIAILYPFYRYLVFIPLFAVSTIIFSTLAISLSILVHPNVGYWGGVLWARFNSIMTPLWLTKIGQDYLNKDESYVLVANHQSYYDILVLVGFLPLNLKWVMKMELRKIPFFGYACHKVGHIFVDRSNRQAAIASIARAKATTQNGTGIMFMPEGTRSATGKLLDFKKGAFRFALDIGLPIVPVTIAGTKDILPRGTLKLFPGPAAIIIHEPIDPAQYGEENMDALIDLVKERIQQGLDDFERDVI